MTSRDMCGLLLATATIFFSNASPNAQAAVGLISQTGGVLGPSQLDQTLGWSFNLNTEVTLNRLGVFDEGQDGLFAPHQVGLWTTSGTLIADATVPAGTGGLLLGDFRYASVADVVLPVGDYVIGVHFTAQAADQFLQDSSLLTIDPFVSYIGRAGAGPGFVFPTPIAGPGGGNFTAGNFQFNIPEPSTTSLCLMASAIGFLISRRFSQF